MLGVDFYFTSIIILTILISLIVILVLVHVKLYKKRTLDFENYKRSELRSVELVKLKISNDLHDSGAFLITELRQRLSLLNSLSIDKNGKFELYELNDLVDSFADTLRDTIEFYYPKELLNQNCVSAIENMVCRFNSENFKVQFLCDNVIDLNWKDDFSHQLFRIVQELFINVIRHAKPSNLILEMYEKNSVLNVIFDSRDCQFPEIDNSKVIGGRGKIQISTRLKLLNGKFSYTFNQETHSQLLTLELPLK